MNEHLDPSAALQQAEGVSARVRRQARWHGWAWLIVAVASPFFLIISATEALPRPVSFWLIIGFMLLAGGLAIWEGRRGVTGRATAVIDRPATWAYVAAMVLVAGVSVAVDITGTPAWFFALAIVPAIPGLIAAWRILTR